MQSHRFMQILLVFADLYLVQNNELSSTALKMSMDRPIIIAWSINYDLQ